MWSAEKRAGWRRRWLFTVCDLPKGQFSGVPLQPGIPTARRGVGKSRFAESQTPERSCEKIGNPCHSERSEESVVACFQKYKCRCFAKFTLSEQTADPSPSADGWPPWPIRRLTDQGDSEGLSMTVRFFHTLQRLGTGFRRFSRGAGRSSSESKRRFQIARGEWQNSNCFTIASCHLPLVSRPRI